MENNKNGTTEERIADIEKRLNEFLLAQEALNREQAIINKHVTHLMYVTHVVELDD